MSNDKFWGIINQIKAENPTSVKEAFEKKVSALNDSDVRELYNSYKSIFSSGNMASTLRLTYFKTGVADASSELKKIFLNSLILLGENIFFDVLKNNDNYYKYLNEGSLINSVDFDKVFIEICSFRKIKIAADEIRIIEDDHFDIKQLPILYPVTYQKYEEYRISKLIDCGSFESSYKIPPPPANNKKQ
jgi:hypothetical protein